MDTSGLFCYVLAEFVPLCQVRGLRRVDTLEFRAAQTYLERRLDSW